MSFREKLAWISLVSITGFAGYYFWSIGHASPTKAQPLATLFGAIVALIVVQTVLSIAVAIHKPKEAQAPRDERDKLIDLKSARVAYSGLVSAVAVACFLEAVAPSITYNANGLLFILVTVELLRLLSQIIQYRRSA